MPHDTEHALTFMDHHHKMYQCLPINSSFPDYLYSLDIGNRASGIIEDLSECECCERHQTYRPSNLMNPSDFPETPELDKSPFIAPWPPVPLVPEHVKCECRCRHFARHLCRAYCVWADLSSLGKKNITRLNLIMILKSLSVQAKMSRNLLYRLTPSLHMLGQRCRDIIVRNNK